MFAEKLNGPVEERRMKQPKKKEEEILRISNRGVNTV
jgi:hypothetical protein